MVVNSTSYAGSEACFTMIPGTTHCNYFCLFTGLGNFTGKYQMMKTRVVMSVASLGKGLKSFHPSKAGCIILLYTLGITQSKINLPLQYHQ